MTDFTPTRLTDRAVIRLAGEDTRSFLQGIVTQDMDAITKDTAGFSALLTPQGKILFDFFISEDDEGFLIDCHAATAPDLLKRLKLYKLRAKVTLDLLEDWGVAVGALDEGFTDPRCIDLGKRQIRAKAAFNNLIENNQLYHAHRLALGVAEFGSDFASEEMFLLDVNYDALNGVSYKKGCFVGQEVTSRMKRKGEVRRRTLIAEFDGSPPAKGAAIIAGETTLGEILSGVEDQALALIRLDRWKKARDEGASPVCEDRPLQLTVPAYLKDD